jgi:hypothetical protein
MKGGGVLGGAPLKDRKNPTLIGGFTPSEKY